LDGSEEALAGLVRPGNAGANTAADKIAVLVAALAQLPKRVAAREAILVRVALGGRNARAGRLLPRRPDALLGRLRLTEPVRTAILALDEDAWARG